MGSSPIQPGPALRLVYPDGVGRQHALRPGNTPAPVPTLPGSLRTHPRGAGILRRQTPTVGDRPQAGGGLRDVYDRSAEAVARENVSSAGLPAVDARWILALQVARQLDGGRAAVLTPERRRGLVMLGERMGLRAFDANLVIAIVQDATRCGERPLGGGTVSRLGMVRPGEAGLGPESDPAPAADILICAGVAVLLGLGVGLTLIAWVAWF